MAEKEKEAMNIVESGIYWLLLQTDSRVPVWEETQQEHSKRSMTVTSLSPGMTKSRWLSTGVKDIAVSPQNTPSFKGFMLRDVLREAAEYVHFIIAVNGFV